jgi:hypothetical protein
LNLVDYFKVEIDSCHPSCVVYHRWKAFFFLIAGSLQEENIERNKSSLQQKNIARKWFTN